MEAERYVVPEAYEGQRTVLDPVGAKNGHVAPLRGVLIDQGKKPAGFLPWFSTLFPKLVRIPPGAWDAHVAYRNRPAFSSSMNFRVRTKRLR